MAQPTTVKHTSTTFWDFLYSGGVRDIIIHDAEEDKMLRLVFRNQVLHTSVWTDKGELVANQLGATELDAYLAVPGRAEVAKHMATALAESKCVLPTQTINRELLVFLLDHNLPVPFTLRLFRDCHWDTDHRDMVLHIHQSELYGRCLLPVDGGSSPSKQVQLGPVSLPNDTH